MTVYILSAWIASFLFGVEGVIGKLTAKHTIKNPWLFNFVWNGIILIFTIPIAFVYHAGIPVVWAPIIAAALMYALSGVFYTWALYLMDISVLSPLFNFRTVFSVLLGAWMLHQMLSVWHYILMGIIFVAGLFVSFDERATLRSFFRFPILVAMIEMVIVAFLGVFTNQAVTQNGYWPTTLWIPILAQVMLTVTWPLFTKDLAGISRIQVGSLSAMAVAGTIGLLAANVAYAGNVGIASAIISLPFSMIIAFAFVLFAPKLLEHHSLKVYAIRFIAAGVMFIAALLLST